MDFDRKPNSFYENQRLKLYEKFSDCLHDMRYLTWAVSGAVG
jgi:hypothetical protein